jgi:hypothetical protein
MRSKHFLYAEDQYSNLMLNPSVPNLAVQSRVPSLPEINHPTSSAQRWASYVLKACKSPEDPKTIGMWARQAAVSYTTLCESCRLIDVRPRQARDFVRVLRLVSMPALDPGQLASFLDISDRRTLDSIVENAGFRDYAIGSQPISVIYFLDNQRFISHENAGLKLIRELFLVS